MALVDPTTFDDQKVSMVYVAGRLSEAKRVEEVLSGNSIDYVVDAERFQTRVLGIIRVEREGVGFYVLRTDAEISRRLLREARLLQGLVEEDLD